MFLQESDPLFLQYYNLDSPVSAETSETNFLTSLNFGLSLVLSNLKITFSLVVTKQPICFNRSKANVLKIVKYKYLNENVSAD